jgi:Fe-S-cluster containining protein
MTEGPTTAPGKCSRCRGSTCCTYTTQALGTLRAKADFDHLLWQVSHEGVETYRDSDGWYLLIRGRCEHLVADGRCRIYADRPQICREYSTTDCEFEDDWCYEKYFETPEQIDEYADALFGPQFPDPSLPEEHSIRSRKPTGLPIA